MFYQCKNILSILLSAVPEGVIIVDVHQKIVKANESVEKIFGYDNNELIDKHLNILIPPKYRAGHKAHFSSFLNQKGHRQMGQGGNFYGIRKDGSIFPLEIGLNNFNINQDNFVMALISDISIRKQQEQERQKLNEELEMEVDKRTKDLKKAITDLKKLNDKLETENQKRIEAENDAKSALKKEQELNELKTKFLSLVSHEFKTPLSGILTSTMLLGKYVLAEQQNKRDKHIKTITEEVHYLNNILNDFLSVEKLEKGKINYKAHEFKLSKVINEVVYNANVLLKEGQLIKYPKDIDDISLYQDEKILELNLSNLINNAIKYSPENSIIDIDVSQDDQITTFKITDEGIGIPEQDQKHIFERYFRAENVLHTQGTGIGLNIVKGHLENLKGSITFNSFEKKGSTFIMELPNKADQ
jgi:PAS domain S-box-containing protein